MSRKLLDQRRDLSSVREQLQNRIIRDHDPRLAEKRTSHRREAAAGDQQRLHGGAAFCSASPFAFLKRRVSGVAVAAVVTRDQRGHCGCLPRRGDGACPGHGHHTTLIVQTRHHQNNAIRTGKEVVRTRMEQLQALEGARVAGRAAESAKNGRP